LRSASDRYKHAIRCYFIGSSACTLRCYLRWG
jgi:hypothetical protein